MLDFNRAVVLASEDDPILVAFMASWCPHCSRLSPIVDVIAERHDITCIPIDVEENLELAQEHNVEAYPDIRLWYHGHEIGAFTGERSVEEVEQWLQSVLQAVA